MVQLISCVAKRKGGVALNPKLREKTLESLSAVLPITGIMLFISIFLVPMALGTMVMFLAGAVMLIVGMGFFQLGAEMSMTPIGEGIGRSKKRAEQDAAHNALEAMK